MLDLPVGGSGQRKRVGIGKKRYTKLSVAGALCQGKEGGVLNQSRRNIKVNQGQTRELQLRGFAGLGEKSQ